MPGVLLGDAVLELSADLGPLDRDLAKAENRIALWAATTQRMLDRHIAVQGQLMDAAAQKAAQAVSDAHVAGAERTTAAYLAQAEAAKAASAASEEAARTRFGTAYEAAGPALRESLERSVATASNLRSGESTAGIWGVRGPSAPGSIGNPIVVVLEAAARTPMGSLAAAIGEASTAGGGGERTTVTAERGGDTQIVNTEQSTSNAAGHGLAPSVADAEARRSREADLLARGVSYVMGNRVQRSANVREMVKEGRGDEALQLVAAASRGGGEGGGGGTSLLGIPMGGGGGNGGMLQKILWGSGLFGIGAGLGTVGSFAGFGLEHLLLTSMGVLGNAAGAVGGGALLGLGAAGQIGVGAGSNAAVMSSTIKDTQSLYQAYEKLNKAILTYGKGSEQAKEAQKELNALFIELGNTAGVKAEAGLARQLASLNEFWDKATSTARVRAVEILSQVVMLGREYVPHVAKAAEENLPIINRGIKPLFAWLEGPEGLGVWNTLERNFRDTLPTSVHAFDQAVELLLKTMRDASGYTGGFMQAIDRFFTKWNEPQHYAVWRSEMSNLIDDFHVWATLVKLMGEDVYNLFVNDAHTGRDLVETIDGALLRLREWEKSAEGRSDLHNIFVIHREEVIALFKALETLISPFSKIYMALAPLAVPVVTALANATARLVKGLTELGPTVSTLLGLGLVAGKLVGFGTLLAPLAGEFRNIAVSLGLVGAAETRLNDVTLEQLAARLGAGGALSEGQLALSGMAGAEGGVATSGLLGGAAGLIAKGKGALSGGSLLLGGAAFLGTNMATEALGLHGTGNTLENIGSAAAFGGLGFALGGPIGAGIGAGLGPPIVHALEGLFGVHSGVDYGRKFAQGFVAPFGESLAHSTATELENRLHSERNATRAARQAYEATRVGEREPYGGFGDVEHVSAAMRKQAFNKLFVAELREGLTAAEVMKQATAGVQHPTEVQFTQTAIRQLHQLPGEAQSAAAEAMVKYAAGLESQGKLPKGSMQRVLASLEEEFPRFQRYMEEHGHATSASVAAAMKLQGAEGNLSKALKNMQAEWGLFGVDVALKDHGIVGDFGEAMGQLEYDAKHYSGSTRGVFVNQMSQLRAEFKGILDDMRGHFQDTMSGLAADVHRGMPGAVKTAETEMQKLATAITSGAEHGAIGLSEASHMMGETINEYMKLFGGQQIPLPQVLSHAVLKGGAALTGAIGAATKAVGGKAGGGLMQVGSAGEAGYDTVPMSIGGENVVVAPGEQVAVFNRHQLPIVNAALAPLGGLEGLFSSVSTPHYMASGGILGKIVGEANWINAQHYPYVWGGGHNSSFSGPYDCSGTWDALLHSVGLVARPMVSGEYMNWGLPGPGAVTLYASPQHMFGSILGRFFGTHGSEGAGWYAGGPLPGYAVRHVPLNGDESLGAVSAPQVRGGGVIGQLMQRGLHKLAGAGNAYIGSHSFGPAAAGASEPFTGSLSGAARMRLNQIAAKHGWSVADWLAVIQLESGGNPRAQNPSGAFGIGQALGATQREFPKMMSPNPVVQIEGMAEYIAARYGSPTAALAHEHAFHWYSRGGLRHFSTGGTLAPGSSIAHAVSKSFGLGARHNPHAARKPHFHGTLTLPWRNPANAKLNALSFLLESEVPEAQEIYTGLTNEYGLHEYGSGELAFVVTEGPYGEQVAPYINQGNVHARLGQLEHLMVAEEHYKSLLVGAVSSASYLDTWVASEIHNREERIAKIQKAIDGLRHHIELNVKRLGSLRKHLNQLEHPKHGKPDTAAIKSTQHIIGQLENENLKMGGNRTELVTPAQGGALKGYEETRSTLREQLTLLGERHSTLGEDLKTMHGISGGGGSLAEANLTVAQLEKQGNELEPGALHKALLRAQVQGGKTPAEEELTSLLKEQLLQTSQALAVSQAQYKVFANLPPFGGSFAEGGMVPGPVGAARWAILHGGETVNAVGAGGPAVHVHVANGMEWLRDYIDVRIEGSNRGVGGKINQPRPSRGGGLTGVGMP